MKSYMNFFPYNWEWYLLIEPLKMNRVWFISNGAAVSRKPDDISLEFENDLNSEISSMPFFLEKVKLSKQNNLLEVFVTSITNSSRLKIDGYKMIIESFKQIEKQ